MYSLELQKIYFPLVFNMQKKKKRLLIKLSPCIYRFAKGVMVKGILKFRVPCHPVEAVPIVLERGTVILARHTISSVRYFFPEQKKGQKIRKTLPKHKTKLKKIEIGESPY